MDFKGNHEHIVKTEAEVDAEIQEMLNNLIKTFGMNSKTLAKVLGVESLVIENYHKYKVTIPMWERGSFIGLLSTLHFIPKITPDERNRAIIEVLTEIHHIDIETIARFANVKKQDIDDFMKDSDSVSFETKYKISSVSIFLHFLFKPKESSNNMENN